MKTILICVDHKWRDLPSSSYLKILLEKKGYDVKLVREQLIEYYIEGYNPYAVIFGHLYDPKRQNFAINLSNRNIKVFLLPTEGIPTLKTYREFASGRFNNLSGVETQFCWNDEMAHIVAKNETLKSVETVGVPRFDFYHKDLKKIFKEKSHLCLQYGIKPNLPIITFATNFTQAQFHTKNKDFFIKDSKTLGYDSVKDKDHINVSDMPKSDFESRELTMNFFLDAVEYFDNYNFIIKTHPAEDFTFYQNFINEKCSRFKDRIALINKEYIWDILNISNIQFSRSCTTAVESWLLGLPTIELRLNKNEWYISEDFSSGSFLAKNKSKAFKLIKKLSNDSSIPNILLNKRKLFFEKWCYKIDGSSTERIVNHIDLTIRENKKPKRIFNLFNYIIFLFLFISNDLIHNIKVYGISYFLGNKYDKLGRQDKYITKKDIQFWSKKLDF